MYLPYCVISQGGLDQIVKTSLVKLQYIQFLNDCSGQKSGVWSMLLCPKTNSNQFSKVKKTTPSFQSIEIGKKFSRIFDNDFHVYLMRGLKKNAIFFSQWLFLKSTFSVLRCTWTGRINLKLFLGHDINYLSI